MALKVSAAAGDVNSTRPWKRTCVAEPGRLERCKRATRYLRHGVGLDGGDAKSR